MSTFFTGLAGAGFFDEVVPELVAFLSAGAAAGMVFGSPAAVDGTGGCCVGVGFGPVTASVAAKVPVTTSIAKQPRTIFV
jgi:hypothetical protein